MHRPPSTTGRDGNADYFTAIRCTSLRPPAEYYVLADRFQCDVFALYVVESRVEGTKTCIPWAPHRYDHDEQRTCVAVTALSVLAE